MNAAINASPVSNVSSVSLRRVRRCLPKASLWALLFVLAALLASRAAYAATYTVTDLTDNASDAGSLRYAVNTAGFNDTINFAPNLIGTITLTNGTLTLNNGGVTIAGPGANLITISGNNAATVFTIITGSTVNISGLTIANGNNSVTSGGGINQESSGALNVSNCTLLDNTAAGAGGGIANLGGTLTVANSTFVGNSAGVGGGIAAVGATMVQNSTFLNNSSIAGADGGAMYDQGSLVVSNSTITGNSGDGIYVTPMTPAPTFSLSNSIVSGNGSGLDCDNCGTQPPNNLIGGAPGLGPLQYNGGTTQTMMPLPGSVAIGAGSSSALATDQRGFLRSTTGSSDLGAVQTSYLTVTNLNDSGAGSLRDAITMANSNGSGDIAFSPGVTGTITLASALPSIVTAHVNLAGPGANLLTLAGPGMPPSSYEVLDISGAGAVVNLEGLTIANGNVLFGSAGGLSNNGFLTMENVAFSLDDGDNGGAVFNGGTLVIENSTFNNNAATQGAGIANQGRLLVANSTFYGNGAYNGTGGGGIENSGGTAVVADSTFYANYAVNGAVGGGIDNGLGTLTLTNSIVSGSTGGGDCNNCGTQNPSNMIGGSPDLGTLAYNGLNATVQTMLPLPGSPAIQAGDATLLPVALTTDARGFPRTTGGKLDLGAAQTNYTAIQFVQQPTNTIVSAAVSPAVTAEVLETNTSLAGPNNIDAVSGIPITLTFNGTGTLGGTLTQTTVGGVASFGDLKAGSTVGTGNTLATTLTVTPAGITPPQTLSATSSSFDITLEPSTVNFNPALPASVTYGVSPLTLKATAYSGSTPTGQSVNFQVDSGPATVSGNVLTITGGGTVVVEVDAAANATYAASDATASIAVAQAGSSLALTALVNQVTTGTSLTPGTLVTLTATATSTTPGTTATPAGTVTFMANGNSIGTAQLIAGVATLPQTTFPAGSTTITATYTGDTNFAGSSAQLGAPIVVGTPTFTITSSPSSLTVQRGQSGTATLTLTPQYGYTGTINLGCNGLPAYSTCNFQPSSVTFAAGGSAVTVTLTLATDVASNLRASSMAWLEPSSPLRSLPILPAMFFWLPGTMFALDDTDEKRQRKTRRKLGRMLVALVALAIGAGALGLAGCGSTSSRTPTGQQTVTITAAGSGGVSQSLAVQVNIQ